MSITAAQLRGLNRLGDVILPGEGDLPSFSASGVASEIDRMLDWMYDADRSSILMLLDICARAPRSVIKGVVLASERGDSAPEPLAGGLRMASIGIKGVILSLYFSGVDRDERIHPAMRWDPTIVMHPEEPDRSRAENAHLPPAGREGHPEPAAPSTSTTIQENLA